MTKAYIWEYVDGVTTRWHSGGGVMIVTDRDPAVVWEETERKGEEDIDTLGVPDLEYYLSGQQDERVIVFPDSGCC